MAIQQDWLWVGADLSETASLTEERLAIRLLTDLAAKTSAIVLHDVEITGMEFKPTTEMRQQTLDYDLLTRHFESVPGLISDKLKSTLEMVWNLIEHKGYRGIVFAYDKVQNLADHADDREYPLSVLLDIFQSIQRKEIPFMLVLVGLPTLFPKLVEARTFSERMFHVLTLDRLTPPDSREAIEKPIQKVGCPYPLSEPLIDSIIRESAGYPYFIQYICREVYDVALQKHETSSAINRLGSRDHSQAGYGFFCRPLGQSHRPATRPLENHCRDRRLRRGVLDSGRGGRTSKHTANPFSASHVSQMLTKLAVVGIVYKNRHGRYCFAVPLFGLFIRRQSA